MASNEQVKLQQHLDLLREQYVRLQQRHAELEHKYTRALSTSGNVGPDHYVSRLLSVVSDLYDKPLYSDITIQLADRALPAHRFVLVARSAHWNPTDDKLKNTASLDLTHLTPFVASCLIRWVYTDNVVLPSDQAAVIEMLSAANQYRLPQLKEKCEQALISTVTVHNCIKLYQTSEEHSASQLKSYCLQIISSHWTDLDTADFAELSAPLLYDMFKAHSSFPLHLAIQHQREDVVFMFIIEHNAELPGKLNECDDRGTIPLNLALLNRHEGIANTLVSHKCDLNLTDSNGNTLLHLAILRGDAFAASFLIKNGASTILSRSSTQETPLHLVALYKQSSAVEQVSTINIKEAPWPCENMADIAKLLLEYHANPDAQDKEGFTPLQRTIDCCNEDTFNALIQNTVLNLDLRNNSGDTALWLALKKLDYAYINSLNDRDSDEDGLLASRLVARGANVDAVDNRSGNSLLHQATISSNEAAAIFLVRHGSLVNHCNQQGEAPIHIAATNGLSELVKVLLQYGADPNLQTKLKELPVSPSVTYSSLTPASLSRPTSRPESPAVVHGGVSGLSSLSLSSQGATIDIVSQPSLNAPTQLFQLSQLSSGSQFTSADQLMLLSQDPAKLMPSPVREKRQIESLNPFNTASDDEAEEVQSIQQMSQNMYQITPMAPVAQPSRGGGSGLPAQRGGSGLSNPQLHKLAHNQSRQSSVSTSPPEREFIAVCEEFDPEQDPGKRTALHLGIVHRHQKVVEVLLEHKEGAARQGRLEIELNVGLADGREETPISLALWTNQLDIALKLLDNGADLETPRQNGNTLLYFAITREQPSACLFLLNHGANFRKRTADNETLLLLAIRHQLEGVADRLCDLGAEIGMADAEGNSPLWVALRSGQESIAAKLIAHGCDPNSWHTSDGVGQSLLHRAIALSDTPTACFLIKSGADIASPTRPSSSQSGAFSPPLHMACASGLDAIVKCLVDHNADVNVKDSEGKTALHVAISHMNSSCSEILLSQSSLDLSVKDKQGQTPFAACLSCKDHKTGKSILQREPSAAEQVDNRGQNFLHLAVLNQDVEAVLFLLSVHVDVNSKVQNLTMNTPLQLAIKNGTEILVRHLLLAGARVGDIDNHQRGVLHMAVEGNFSVILSVLLESKADPDQIDEEGNNALHIAMQYGHLECARVLIEDTNINLLTTNMMGRNCLHLLAATNKDNAASMFFILMNVVPNFPINKQDADGYTALLLAYHCGNSALCDGLIQSSAHPGISNKDGMSIFNFPVATKQLLFRILDQIQSEPNWLEGQNCMECRAKFNISTRKHHCRHCGRLLCNKCTSTQMPIVKFDLNKPVRVCEVCGDSFRLGAMR